MGEKAADKIDMSAIDANEGLNGRQSFTFGEAGGAGRLWAVDKGVDTHIRGNVDGGRGWDFELVVADKGVRASAYAEVDFVGLG